MDKDPREASQNGRKPLSDADVSVPGELANIAGMDEETRPKVNIKLDDCIVYAKSGPLCLNHDVTARWVLQKSHVAHLIETENTLIYRDGVYEDFAEAHLKKALFDSFEGIRKFTGESLISTYCVNEIMARLCVWSLKPISAFKCNQHVFNMANGVLDLDTYELMPHSPNWMLMSKSPVRFDSDAECPQFLEILDQSLEPNYHQLIGEFIGYVLWTEHQIHKAFMFLGPKRTGKGTMIRVIQAVVGDRDCSHVSLQDLIGNRFMRARLFGKKLNSSGDLPATPIKDAGIFKNLTGEDTIDAENKFEHPFGFQNTSKLLFSANALPKMKIHDDAFYNRWIIVPFNNSVFGREDTKLTARLTTPEELSGIMNFGIDGLKRLKENGWKFTYGDDAAAIYRRNSEPIIAFLEDRCEVSDGYVVKSELVEAYNQYAKKMRLPIASSKKAFGKTMIDQTVIPVDTMYPSVNGRQVEAWRGIRLKV